MIDNIDNFLGVYPNIHNYSNENLNSYDDDFYLNIFKKKEFYDNRLEEELEDVENFGPVSTFKHQKTIAMYLNIFTNYDKILLLNFMGTGKCHKKDTPIILHDGSIKMVQDIVVGDLLMGDDSTPRLVTSLARGEDEMYDIIPVKGEKYTVNEEHILCLKMSGYPYLSNCKINQNYNIQWIEDNKFKSKTFTFRGGNKEEKEKEAIDFLKKITNEQIIEIRVKDFLKLSKSKQETLKTYRKGIDFPEKELPFDPYMIGYWLGDGGNRDPVITSQDSKIIHYFTTRLKKYDLLLNYQSGYSYRISGYTGKIESNEFINILKTHDLKNNKHIPDLYKYNSRDNRLKLLAGLIDSDGSYLSSGVFEFTQKNEKLMDDVIYLSRSLGFACYKNIKKTSWTYKGVKKYGTAFRICISGDIDQIPTLIERKKANPRKQVKDVLVSSIKVKHVGRDKYYGFTLDGNCRYLMGDFTVTHNTCASVAAIELIKKQNSSIDGAIILAKGKPLLNNYTNEVVFKCTVRQYKPLDYENLTDLQKTHRVNKSIERYYDLEDKTFELFSDTLAGMSDEAIIENYSNKIIVVDEVHNIRLQKTNPATLFYEEEVARIQKEDRSISSRQALKLAKERWTPEIAEKYNAIADKKSTYKQIHRFLHLVKNCKIILMSATPMKDQVEEIATIMNLILPLDKQLPVKEEFIQEYFNVEGNEIAIKPDKVDYLKNLFKGKISYLDAAYSNIDKKYIGTPIGSLKHFNVFENIMSEFQTKYYNEAYRKDVSNKENVDDDSIKSSFFTNARQASLFVFPNGTYGKEGYTKYVSKKKRQMFGAENDKVYYNYSLNDELKTALYGGKKASDPKTILTNLLNYSTVYSSIIKNILENPKKLCFIYSEYIHGSGSFLFACILELFGFSKCNGTEANKGKRYAIVNTETCTPKEIKDIINYYNKPQNMFGEYVRVIIGSSVISEGFSLYNVQSIHVLTPHWNYSETSQAIARGIRAKSHKLLQDQGITPELDIFQHVSIPLEGVSIDLRLYEISEIKDVNIKRFEKILKESAFDCALNYKRNYKSSEYEGTRDCNYGKCEYQCDGVSKDLILNGLPNSELDYSTYELYYDTRDIENITFKVFSLFKNNFFMNLDAILKNIIGYTLFQIVTALRNIINDNVVIFNKYGFKCYLREQKNIYYLIDNLSSNSSFLSYHYSEYPELSFEKDFFTVIDKYYYPQVIKSIFKVRNIDQLKNIIIKLPLMLQEYLLEQSLISNKEDIDINKSQRDLILEYFKSYYTMIDDTLVSSLLYHDEDVLKCYDPKNKTWGECDDDFIELFKEQYKEERTKFERTARDLGFGYSGQYNIQDDGTEEFCIKESKDEDEDDDARVIKSGRRCVNWDRPELTRLAVDVFKIPPDERSIPSYNKLSEYELLQKIKNSKYVKDLYLDGEEYTKEDLVRGLYWSKIQRPEMCGKIKEWFRVNNLLREDKNCGTQNKKKK